MNTSSILKSYYLAISLILISPSLFATEVLFGVYQSDKASEMYKTFAPIASALSKRLSAELGTETKVKLKIFKTYDQGLSSLVNGKVDFVRFGPASYILAKQQNPDISLLAMEVKKGGKKKFKGVIVVPKESPINTISELKNARFAFGDRNSTIGRFLSQAMLVENGVYGKDLKAFSYLGQHDKVAKAVQIGDFDAGAVKSKTFKKYNKAGHLRSLASFDVVTKPWIASSKIDPIIKTALSKALIALDDKDALKVLKVQGFSATNDDVYAPIREGMTKAVKFTDQ